MKSRRIFLILKSFWAVQFLTSIKISISIFCRTLLNKVAEILPAQLKIVAPEDTYNVGKHPESAALTVSGGSVTVSVTLTSPLMRDAIKPTTPAGKFDRCTIPRRPRKG